MPQHARSIAQHCISHLVHGGAAASICRRLAPLLTARALQVLQPRNHLQQLCHRSEPPLPAPRFAKTSGAGEPFRYSCTIVFPAPRFKRKNGGAAARQQAGPRTWELLEAQDGWQAIQEAQGAVALKALFELAPEVAATHQLPGELQCAMGPFA